MILVINLYGPTVLALISKWHRRARSHDRFSVRGVDDGEVMARRGIDPSPIDVELAAVLHELELFTEA